MLRAATAPMLLAVPTAVTHRPTFSADALAVIVLRYVLAEVVITVTLVSVAVPEPAARVLAWTTKPPADTDVTLPSAPPKVPLPKAPWLPVGRGRALKLGRGVAPVPVPPRPTPPNPPPPNPPAPVQSPLTGALMVTLVAVTDLAAAPAAEGLPTTVTQLPTVTSFDVTLTVSVIGVLAVKVTVTCPEVGFWTSRLDPDTAAAVPTTPGKADGAAVGVGLLPGAAELAMVAAGVAALPELPPQAVTPRTTIPSPARAGAQRRPAADARFVAAAIMMRSHPCRCSFAAQRVDRGEPGGAGGRVNAEDNADADRDHDRADGGDRRDRDRVADQVREHHRAGQADARAENPAGQAGHAGLDQELAADGPLGRPERLAQPDLAAPLGDRDEHDVHNADPAHQRSEGGDAREQLGQRLVDRRGGRQQRLLTLDGEVG